MIFSVSSTPSMPMPMPMPMPTHTVPIAPAAPTAAAAAAWRIGSHKLAPPAAQTNHIERAPLMERMVRAQGQLLLLTAPAGFGKSTTLRQAHDQLIAQGVCCLWLTLDGADNDASRLTACLQAACQKAGLLAPTQNAIAPDPDITELLLHHPKPWALLLDEVEVLHEAGVLALLRELAERLPPHAHLLMAARKPPAMGLARLRVRGRLTEIDAEQLRFQPEDVQRLFAQNAAAAAEPALALHAPQSQRPARAVSAQHMATLCQKTEGWPAALSLAQLALQRSANPDEFVARFSGSDRAVADYLSEDVLSGLAPELQRFLLRTSILRQLDASICNALNPAGNSAELLRQLDEQRLFLTPVDSACRTWRYHSLFADFLRSQLERLYPQEVARLHLAASSWYESHGRPVPATEHAIEGGDLPHALSLMAEHAERLLEQGRMRLLTRWFTAIPEPLVQAHPRLEAVAIWALSLTQGPWVAMQRLDRSAPLLDTPALKAHARSMRTMFLAMQDRYDEALASGNHALPALPTGEVFADATLLNAMAHVTSVFFDEHQVRPLLEASRAQQLPDSRFNRMYTEAIVGMLDLMQGRLQQATERFQIALQSAPKHSLSMGRGNAWAGVLYTHSLYEGNHLAQARHQLNVYQPMVRDTGLPDHMILSHTMHARMAHWEGDLDTAQHTLSALETLGHQRHMQRVVAAAQLERAQLALLRKQPEQALAHLQAAQNPALWSRERRQFLIANETQYLQLAQLRWQIAFGKASQWPDTDQALAQEMHLALQGGRQRRLLVLKLLRAVLQERMGHWDSSARSLLAKALRSAASEGHVRLVLDEGWVVLPVLTRLHAEQDALPQDKRALLHDFLPMLLAQLHGIWPPEPCDTTPTPKPDTRHADHAPSSANAQSSAHAMGREALTQREQQVLHLLVEGYSNNAMAEKLFLSDSTVRTHLRSINQKLGAKSRTHAVAMARRLGWVS